jgi:hypothetical protein
VTIVAEEDGFVYMRGEERETPTMIEKGHLNAIQKASFVWLHAPEGYVGFTSALEIGFAHAAGVPILAREAPNEPVFRSFVRVVASPSELVTSHLNQVAPPAPALRHSRNIIDEPLFKGGIQRKARKNASF